jgi:hypothetical protein
MTPTAVLVIALLVIALRPEIRWDVFEHVKTVTSKLRLDNSPIRLGHMLWNRPDHAGALFAQALQFPEIRRAHAGPIAK